VQGGKLIDERRHLERLARSLKELKIALPMPLNVLGIVLRETIERNRVRDGIVYLQVTRGVAKRDHAFPAPGTKPSVVVLARAKDRAKGETTAAAGIPVITVKENRWDRVDIKSIGLLPNVLVRQDAREKGAGEAWFVDRDGFVTEGSSSNAWIVTRDKKIVTRPADHGILRGITRTVVMDVAKKLGHTIEERPFTVEEALAAAEAFVTAATQIVMPVVQIDGKPIGNGHPGLVATTLRAHFYEAAEITG
jgi:D-alanine transaminase